MGLIAISKIEDVEAIRFGKYNLADNSTVLIYIVGNTLIDTAPPNQRKGLLKFLSDREIEKIILTHHHEDHSGNAKAVADYFNIPVFIHESGIDILKTGFKIKAFQKVFWGSPGKIKAMSLPEEIDCGNGIKLKTIHTLGHSEDHVCFFEEKRKWLFTGDNFLSSAPKLFRLDEDLEKEIKSLETILKYDFKTIFCSHRGFIENGYEVMEKKLKYFRELIKKVHIAKEQGLSIKAISKQILGKKDFVGLISFSYLSQKNLIKKCLEIISENKI